MNDLLKRLRESAKRNKIGRAFAMCNGHSIAAHRWASGTVRFKLDDRWTSTMDIAAFLHELEEKREEAVKREQAKKAEMPNFTDEERLNFVGQTGATWHRDKYKLSGCLTWFIVWIGGRAGSAATTGDTYRQALDKAIREYKLKGGVIRDQSDLYAASEPAHKRSPECVIIYGPQGCGKTLNASKFAAHYGGHCIDYEQIGTEDKSVNVVFTDSHSSALRAHHKIKSKYGQKFRIVSFEDALKECGQ